MIQCPSCNSSIEDDSQFCDQCARRLAPPESSTDGDDGGRCPDCGGEIKDLGQGKGECSACGIRFDEAPADYSEDAEALMYKNLAATVSQKIKDGSPMEAALSLSCSELGLRLTYAAPTAAPATPKATPAATEPTEEGPSGEPCPICSAANSPLAARCRDCGVYFNKRPRMECPRCFRDGFESSCACGAILTLPRLLELFDASTKSVCRRCKQLYSASRSSCADCGGALASAESLKKRWNTR